MPRSSSRHAPKKASACTRRRWSLRSDGWFLARQFETDANAEIHEATTAARDHHRLRGQRLDYFVTGYGTGGTVTGIGRVIRKEIPDEDHPHRTGQRVDCRQWHAQHRRAATPPEAIRQGGAHPIQGWTPDFIPLVLQEWIDELLRRS